jgi:hypothetical protein
MTLKFELIIVDHNLYYYKHGKRHRTNGPANIYNNGNMFWFKYGIYEHS